MPSTLGEHVLAAIRVLLVAGGLFVAAVTVVQLATMPPATPDSDGFVTGLAYFFGSIVFVLAVGAASLGVILPTVLGAPDPLGFNRWQRLLLKVAAATIGGGFLLGLTFGTVTEMQFGFFLWLFTIVIAVLIVCVAVGWRTVEVGVRGLARLANDPT